MVLAIFVSCLQFAEKEPIIPTANTEIVAAQITSKDSEIKSLIAKLSEKEWHGPEAIASPLTWEFNFSSPMCRILEIGNASQNDLLSELGNDRIKAQIIILLGGVGDEKSVEPIINSMVSESDIETTLNSLKINLSANIALTNITVADVIWHHGGGIVITRPPKNSKELWKNWWEKNKKTFTVKNITQSRNYSNYPDYGIYRDKRNIYGDCDSSR